MNLQCNSFIILVWCAWNESTYHPALQMRVGIFQDYPQTWKGICSARVELKMSRFLLGSRFRPGPDKTRYRARRTYTYKFEYIEFAIVHFIISFFLLWPNKKICIEFVQ